MSNQRGLATWMLLALIIGSMVADVLVACSFATSRGNPVLVGIEMGAAMAIGILALFVILGSALCRQLWKYQSRAGTLCGFAFVLLELLVLISAAERFS